MQVLMYVLCFVLGVVSTIAVLVYWAWYLGMQERIRVAEESKKIMENALKSVEDQQRAAVEELQNSLAELVKRRKANQQVVATPTATATAPSASSYAPTDSSVTPSVKERLRKAVEITSKQSKIDVKQGPESLMQHNELELEKLTVLKTILADGFDPVITIRYSTGDQEMLLSTYVQSISKGLA